jgi:hypothetical protein
MGTYVDIKRHNKGARVLLSSTNQTHSKIDIHFTTDEAQ